MYEYELDHYCCICCSVCPNWCQISAVLLSRIWMTPPWRNVRKIIGGILSLCCLAGIIYYWATDITKLHNLWKYDYVIATGYKQFDLESFYDFNMSVNATKNKSDIIIDYEIINVRDSVAIIFDPSKIGFTKYELTTFYKNDYLLVTNQNKKKTKTINDINNNINSQSIVILYELTDFEQMWFDVLAGIIKVFVTLGYGVKLIICVSIWLYSWTATVSKFLYQEIEQFNTFDNHYFSNSSMCCDVSKRLLIISISITVPLMFDTFLLLPFETLQCNVCLSVISTMPSWITFSNIFTIFGTAWSIISIMFICGCCYYCRSRCSGDKSNGTIVCCCLKVIAIPALISSGILGFIVIFHSKPDTIFNYFIYVCSVASLQVWLLACVSNVPKCRFDHCCD